MQIVDLRLDNPLRRGQPVVVTGHYYDSAGALTGEVLRYRENGWRITASSPQIGLGEVFADVTLDGCCVSFTAGQNAAGEGVIGQHSINARRFSHSGGDG